MPRYHDKTHFYKYMSAETAVKVISNQSLRWSNPLLFNDPFDHQIDFTFDFDGAEFAKCLYQEMKEIIFEGKRGFESPSDITRLAILFGDQAGERVNSEVMERLGVEVNKIEEEFPDFVESVRCEIRKHLTNSRVLCVSEECDNVVMWSHYADEHRGVVIKLKCIDELDNALLQARQVRYSDEFPKFPSVEEYVKNITGEKKFDFSKMAYEIPYIKHKDWSYEKEWRVHLPLIDEPHGDGYSLYKENPRVLGSVYLGCRVTEESRRNILSAIEEHIPHANVLQARKNATSFGLTFENI